MILSKSKLQESNPAARPNPKFTEFQLQPIGCLCSRNTKTSRRLGGPCKRRSPNKGLSPIDSLRSSLCSGPGVEHNGSFPSVPSLTSDPEGEAGILAAGEAGRLFLSGRSKDRSRLAASRAVLFLSRSRGSGPAWLSARVSTPVRKSAISSCRGKKPLHFCMDHKRTGGPRPPWSPEFTLLSETFVKWVLPPCYDLSCHSREADQSSR